LPARMRAGVDEVSASGNLLGSRGVYLDVREAQAMRRKRASEWVKGVVAAVLFSCAMVCNGRCQAPPTFIEALEQHHVSTTPAALLEALHDADKEVRGLAAAELAEQKVTAALPAIVRAAEEEKDPQTRVNLASAATWMGSQDGVRILKVVCEDGSYSAWIRLAAARGVFGRGDHSCFPAIVGIIRSGDAGARMEALSAAAYIRPKTDQESTTVLSLAVLALEDPDISVRLEACEALRWLKDVTAIESLQRVIRREREEVVRTRMAATLADLLKDHPGR